MQGIISFAGPPDTEDVQKLLSEYDLAMCGEIEDYVVLKVEGKIWAAGRLVQVGKDCFHLEVLGVKSELRKRGAGGFLLSRILAEPRRYCRGAAGSASGLYRVTTVARGEAAGFYEKYGFRPAGFTALAPPYDVQCEGCPDREICRPLPMVFEGRKHKTKPHF